MLRRWVWILLLPAVAAAFVGRTPRCHAKSPRPIAHYPVPVVGEAPPPPPARVPRPVTQATPQLSPQNAFEIMLGVSPGVADEMTRRLTERDQEAERIDEEQRQALDERVDREIEAFLFGESLERYRSMRADGRIAGTAP